eukprot:3266080-Amphidinium_carterae.1
MNETDQQLRVSQCVASSGNCPNVIMVRRGCKRCLMTGTLKLRIVSQRLFERWSGTKLPISDQ